MRVHSMRQLKKRIKKRHNGTVAKGDASNYNQFSEVTVKRIKPPPPQYKMPPQPIMQHFESQLPGAASEIQHNLRTHSSKFPIERELILSNDNKNASKVPLSTGLHQFIPKMAGSVAPDHPVKQMQAWNQINHSQIEQMRPTQMPEDVTALADRDHYGTKENGKNPVAKTYHTIKDIISAKFKKDQVTTGSLDELNNASAFQQQIVNSNSPYAVKKARPIEMQTHVHNGQRPHTDSPVYHMHPQQYLNMQTQYQRAASQPQLYDNRPQQFIPTPAERRGSVDNVEVTDSDDGGFISKARQRANEYLSGQQYYDRSSVYRPQSTLEHINERPNGDDGRQSRGNQDGKKSTTPVNSNSDYEKGENMGNSSNVDSGRESLAYSSGTRPQTANNGPEQNGTEDNAEWVDIVETELKHILEPGMQDMNIQDGESMSSMSPTLSAMSPPVSNPPHRPPKHPKDNKPEYGTDSYNRASSAKAIGPTKGYPSSSATKREMNNGMNGINGRKQMEQSLLKRHLFGLDVDLTSTTTRSFDLESLLGIGQSVSDSETDTNGLRNIKYQLEGLENMYSEVLRMLKTRKPQMTDSSSRAPIRRRYGSISSLPSSSVSSRPIRDKKRVEERRKIRDIKGINKRFQRLESHVVTLARSVAHLSSEMRSQHLVSQEIEMLKSDVAALRAQAGRPSMYISQVDRTQPEPPNLTNPKRVKKLTKFFGDDPPLLRLFLRKLGYEKYAQLFENEKVGMIELPYLGEERLQKMGVPLGPRLRILQEAQISLCKDTTLCIL